MNPKIKKRIWLIWGIVQSVLIVCAGGALILACLTIYNSPEGTFSRATVGAAFGRISVLVWAAVGSILVGAVLSCVMPQNAKRHTAKADERVLLRRMTDTFDLSTLPTDTMQSILRLRRTRKNLTIMAAVASVVLAIPAVVWVVLPDSFGVKESKTDEVMVASAIVLGCAVLAMLICSVIGAFNSAYCRRERDIIKLAVAKREAVKRVEPPSRPVFFWDKPATVWAVRGTVLAAAAVFIVLGVCNGGMRDVLGKAIRICTECIGLG